MNSIILLLVSCTLFVHGADILNEIDSDFIECYWCNSRDAYCGKRVIDTMVSTVKCPKQSRCVVYTNPYDNYFLHRGCTYGMDLGQMVVQNGCYVEEEGATYCFCDFNRCNAAGILDLRNLIDENMNTTKKTPKKLKDRIKEFTIDKYLNDDIDLTFKNRKQPHKAPVLSSYSNNFKHYGSFMNQINPITKHYNKLISQYMSYSNYKNGKYLQQDELKNHINQTMKQNLKNQELLKKYQNISHEIKHSITKNTKNSTTQRPILMQETTKTTPTKSMLPIELLKQINKLSTKFSTKKLTTRTPVLSTTSEIPPLLYKLKINDTLSKSLLDDPSIRHNLGIKPNEQLSILIKKPVEENSSSEFKVTSIPNLKETQPKYFNTNEILFNNEYRYSSFQSEPSTTTLSWLLKLKAKLSQALSSTHSTQNFMSLPVKTFESLKVKTETVEPVTTATTTDFTPSTTSINEWTHVLSESYKQNLASINFKCPRDGLFSNPKNCSTFLQCVDFGTFYERFYVQNCPKGLYFNEKLELCDYLDNVVCPENSI